MPETIAGATNEALVMTEICDAATWDGLLARAERPQLTQGFAYGVAKAAKHWRVVRMLLSLNGVPVALCQVLEKRVLGVRLVSRINRGPLLMAGQSGNETILAVYRAIRRRWGRWYGGPLSLAPGLLDTPTNVALLEQAGYRCRKRAGWWSGRIDLLRPLEAISAGFSSGFRNRLKKSHAGGLTLLVSSEIDMVDWMIERHLENMRDKQFLAVDAQFLSALRATAPENYVVFQALADGVPVAGMSVVRYGDIAEYHTGWFGPAGRQSNAGNFLMWSIMVEMRARGCALFDIGGLYQGHGYTQFKRGMRPHEYQLVGEWVAF